MNPDPPPRVLIADDHDVARAGLSLQIERYLPGWEIREVADGLDVIDAIAEGPWGLIMLDIGLPGRSGLDLIPEIRSRLPHVPLLIVTAFSEQDHGVRAMKLGASGFLHKSSTAMEMPAALEKLLAGESYITPSLASALADSISPPAVNKPHELLSHRELEVLRHIADGEELQQIAGEMNLSYNTINTYRSRIYRKLSLRNNVEITRYAFKNNLVH